MNRPQQRVTDRELKAWLAAGAVDRGVGEGLTFIGSAVAAQAGKASWILRYRMSGRSKEKVLGRYPELSLKDARELARQDRAKIERGIEVAVTKQTEKHCCSKLPRCSDLEKPGSKNTSSCATSIRKLSRAFCAGIYIQCLGLLHHVT